MKIKFFLIPFYIPDNYSPEAISLAEGLEQLGHEILCNINYWFIPEENRHLFTQNDSEEYDVGIYDYKYLYHAKRWTFNRINSNKINILLDRNDWLIPEWKTNEVLNKFDFILACHLLKNVSYPKNVYPWAIGYTNRIEKYLIKQVLSNENDCVNEVIYNFRVNHNLRGLIINNLKQNVLKYPLKLRFTDTLTQKTIDHSNIDQLYWKQTAKRHNPEYYKLLNSSLLSLAFGGYYEFKPFFYQPYTNIQKFLRKPAYLKFKLFQKLKLDISGTVFVFQYDSFRMWESLLSKTCPVLLEFNYWNFKLPVTPTEGVHYLGITNLDSKNFIRKVNAMSTEQIKEIGLAGSKWVQEHYSPNAVARRLLSLLEQK